METRNAPSLRVCIEIEDGKYIAQCVDYDISGEGATIDIAIESFIRLYMKNVLVAVELGVEPLVHIPPAPSEYAERWRNDVLGGNRVYTKTIPAVTSTKPNASYGRYGSVEAAVSAAVSLDAA